MINQIKKTAGIIWIILGPLAMFYLFKTAISEITLKPTADTIVQWSVFILVFFPIAIGLVLFGWYALNGEYDHLPQSSIEIKED